MDVAHSLVRTIVRSFYTVKHTLIIDALVIHSVLTTDDFAYLLGQQSKDVRRLLHPLKQARLLSTKSRQETRDGYQKAVSREYYYIPLHPAIDAIKFKLWKIQNKVNELYKPNEERKEWKCPRCGAEWNQFEVLDSAGPNGFECHRCHGLLEPAANAAGNAAAVAGHEKQNQLQERIRPMIDLMRRIDSQEIPENDFESAWERKKDVPRDEGYISRTKMVPVGKGIGFAKAGTGKVDQTDTNKLAINVGEGDELSQAERLEAEKKKAAAREQNLLPVWHTQSAIGIGGPNVKMEEVATNGIKTEELVDRAIKPEGGNMGDDTEAIFAELERERQRNAEKAALAAQDAAENDEEEESEDDEDEEDFEDVPSTNVGTPLPGNTPLGSSQVSTNGVKRERDNESGSTTSVNTPADTPNAKRVKLEGTIKKEDQDSDEDEEEFEDV